MVAVSPDGRQIVHTTTEGLALRSPDQVTPVLVEKDVEREDVRALICRATDELFRCQVAKGAPRGRPARKSLPKSITCWPTTRTRRSLGPSPNAASARARESPSLP